LVYVLFNAKVPRLYLRKPKFIEKSEIKASMSLIHLDTIKVEKKIFLQDFLQQLCATV